MTTPTHFLAIDLGAESGRAMLLTLSDGRASLREIHRFPNGGVRIGRRLVWDIIAIFSEIQRAMRMTREALGAARLSGMAIDSWGVDYGLIDHNGDLVGPCFHYRDERNEGIIDKAARVVPKREIFARTGIQFLRFNTLFQLHSMRLENSPALDAAERLLMIPDLLNFWLTGRMTQEYTNATTTQALDPATGDWARDLIESLGVPSRIFGDITRPGVELGGLAPHVARETGLTDTPVLLVASHDTASAVASVPASTPSGWAYISCGTWALIGAETREAVINDDALAFNFTNEGGVFGTYRLLSNVMGLWLMQEARRAWTRAGLELDYARIAAEAAAASPFAALIDPDDPGFFNPDDMIAAITSFCSRTGQRPPQSVGAIARCIIESLALKYCLKIEQIEKLTGSPVEVIHMVGGGSRNELLCQATADACGRRVVAGPDEGTALGNGLMQAVAVGAVSGLEELREIVSRSFEPREYLPAENRGAWSEAYATFMEKILRP